MANPLTGDFEAVLQVSGSTLNRLLASIHQNGGATTERPHFPHSVRLRVGDPTPIEGMRGSASAQVGAPRIELIHGSEDRFRLEVAVRARYVPDPGSVRLPEFIHGTVRAEYRLDDIDPACRGWRTRAAEFLWIRVDGDTVSFTGSAVDDASPFAIPAMVDEAATDARITRLIRHLLQHRFQATPHRVSRRFRRGSMRSLNLGHPQSAVTIPLSLSNAPPQGRIDSVTQYLLDGSDFGVAIGREAVLSRVQPALDELRAGFVYNTPTFQHRTYLDLGFLGDVDLLEVTVAWRVTLTKATAQWVGGAVPFLSTTAAVVMVTIEGQALTSKPFFNWNFNATVLLQLTFDAAGERLVLSQLGAPAVTIHGPFGAIIEPRARPQMQAEIAARVNAAIAQLGDQLSLKSRKAEMVDQLRTMDEQPDAYFEELVGTPDGVIVRGRIYLSPRRGPVHGFVKTPSENGFDAFESWIPGGRIDTLTWSWTWYNNAGERGSAARSDRFLLRRPAGARAGKFGTMLDLSQPLPGLDGMGRMCLRIAGAHAHPFTGEMVPVSTGPRCTRFGFEVRVATPGRLFLREWVPGPRDPIGPVAETALVEVSGRGGGSPGVNTLVIFVGEEWGEADMATLRDGLSGSQRRDAGLLVLALFRDGVLAARGAQLMPDLARFAAELEAPLVVNEDVRGNWARALSVESEGDAPEWRLLSPTGGMIWAHGESPTSRELAEALDAYLFPTENHLAWEVRGGIKPGDRLVAADMRRFGAFEMEDPCPPPPFGLGLATLAVFAQRGSRSSDAAIRRATAKAAEEHAGAPLVAVILDGSGPEDVDGVRSEGHEEIMTILDPEGLLAHRFGVRSWPMTVAVNEQGIVTSVEVGAEAHDENQDEDGARLSDAAC